MSKFQIKFLSKFSNIASFFLNTICWLKINTAQSFQFLCIETHRVFAELFPGEPICFDVEQANCAVDPENATKMQRLNRDGRV